MRDLTENGGISIEALSKEDSDTLSRAFSAEGLLQGYEKEGDGTVVVFYDNAVMLSDDPNFPVGESWEDFFGMNAEQSLDQIAQSDELYQTAYDSSHANDFDSDSLFANSDRHISTQAAYMRAQKAGDYYIMILYPGTKVFAGRVSVMLWTTLTVMALLIVIFLFASWLLNRIVVRHVDETNGVLAKITAGNLEERVDVRDTREFKSLSQGINTTVDALRGWIAEAETRMEAELNTAKAIQESALPRTFPPFPDIRRFDIYANMHAAREVGGDFYDFFLIGDDCDSDNGKLGFVVADVSGKGVPAALFMMTAKTLIRDYVSTGMDLGEAVENANRQLCEGNDAGMFVTAFVGILDYGTGHVTYVNAGHNPPLVWQKGGWRWITDKSGLPLGLFDGLPYDSYEMDCEIGDQFLLYSDGVTEAMDVDGKLYGEDRLKALLDRKYALHPRMLVGAVRYSVAGFAHGAVQSDDITILALEVGVPPEVTATLIVPADVAELPRVNDFVHTELDRRLCPLKAQNQLDIAIEELFVNVAHYAYPDATAENPGTVRVSYTYSAEPPSIEVEIADDGIPYDPLAKPDAATADSFDSIADVPIGGLGILMAKQSVDDMTYERLDNSNVVTIKKRW